ncbi:MAG: hypothetical protein EPN22_07535 [Nitrospirae bacterium]|nr:MAG: hypothetical protein EPN22_07535 [Nitrospirota bacterium]
MEKKSSPNDDASVVKLYAPVQFESSSEIRAKELKTEKDIVERVRLKEKEGYDKGYKAAYEKTLGEAKAEIDEKLRGLESLIASLEDFSAKLVDKLMPEIISLSSTIARKVILKEVSLDRTIVMKVAAEAIKKVSERDERIAIRINPLDYELMVENSEFFKELSGLKDIVIEPSHSISRGGCYIETQTGEIDARIEEKFKELDNVIDTATNSQV